MEKMDVCILVILMLSAIGPILKLSAIEPMTIQSESQLCEPEIIICVCKSKEKMKYVPVELELETYNTNPDLGKKKCSLTSNPHQACANMSCFFPEMNPLYEELLNAPFPVVFTVPQVQAGANPGSGRFSRSMLDPCEVKPLHRATITCTKWSDWKKCDIICAYGYALEDDKNESTKVKTIHCNIDDNVWKPHGFIECLPYEYNCLAELHTEGTMECIYPAYSPNFCYISCGNRTAEEEPIALQKYECSENNPKMYGESLPHCASLYDGKILKKPKSLE